MSDDKKPTAPAPSAAAPASGVPATAPAPIAGAPQSTSKPGAAVPPPPPAPGAKPPPKNPGMVTFTVDGKEVVAKPGTNMIEAAKQVGVEIPYYCWHPRLSIAANCRMCLVESSTSPKLVPACQTAIAEGMAIKATSAKVQEQQRAVMEFLLLNHPVDCSICDQAGECKLQDYYMRYDHKSSRLERISGIEDGPGMKVLRNKRKVLGPTVVLDQERCVLCTRCVRFMDEVAKEPQLGVFGRGSHERIDVHPQFGELKSNYSGNTVDICPVGALLNRDFRFRARAWFLSAAPSVCTGCSRGCSTFADFMGQDTYRYRPRENEQINKSWMCDQGRLSYKSLNKGRVLQSVIGRGADAREAGRAEAVKYAAAKLKPLVGSVAVAASPVASNEDLMAGLTFARDVLGAKSVYVSGRPAGEADHFLMMADKNPNRRGLESIAKALGLNVEKFEKLSAAVEGGQVKALYAIGAEMPDAGFAAKAATLELLVLQATNEDALTAQAQVLLPASTHVEDEGTFTQEGGITQRFRRAYPPKGDAQPHWKWAVELAKEMGGSLAWSSSREVFRMVAPTVPELASFEWDKQAPVNIKQGISVPAASADGRPPGWREFGAPRVKGI
ncbi:MAG: (2Fe-2S)-binding protein [Archangiaceae bacterium]|nr:(2Fe-2S)-binding protein [Archangiaceae bacterium]